LMVVAGAGCLSYCATSMLQAPLSPVTQEGQAGLVRPLLDAV